MELEKYYNYLIDYELVSEEALDIITNIIGYSEKTLDSVLYVVSGYHDIEQYLEYEDMDTYLEYYKNESEDDFDE
jgi:hypothetical protein